MHLKAVDPIYEVVNNRTGIIAKSPEFVSESFHNHLNCASYQRLLQEGNYTFYSSTTEHREQCTHCAKLYEQAKPLE